MSNHQTQNLEEFLHHLNKQPLVREAAKIDISKLTCMICMDIVVDAMQCGGCLNLFCNRCVSKWRKIDNICPTKCSKQWKLQHVGTTGVELNCPYSQECSVISKPEEFEQHLNSCPWMPTKWVEQLAHKINSQCLQGHKLQFFYEKLTNQHELLCSGCKQRTFCRMRCRQCSVFYCKTCREIPFTKHICPKEHVLVYKNSSPGSICDMCGLQPYYLNRKFYQDLTCQVGVCQECYQSLPMPPRHLISWVQDEQVKQGNNGLSQKMEEAKRKALKMLKQVIFERKARKSQIF